MKAITSLEPEEFEALLPKFEARWLDYIEKYTLDGKPRLNKYTPKSKHGLFSIEEKLFFILVHHKQNPTQEFLAFSFDLDQDMANKWIKVLMPILEKTLHKYRAEENEQKINEIIQETETYHPRLSKP